MPSNETREHSKHSMQLKSEFLNKWSKPDSKCVCAKVLLQLDSYVSQLNDFVSKIRIDGSNQPGCSVMLCNCFFVFIVVWLKFSFPGLLFFFSFHFELHFFFSFFLFFFSIHLPFKVAFLLMLVLILAHG